MDNKVQMQIFFYWIHYPSAEPQDCWWETDIMCISKTRQIVEDAWRKNEADFEQELSEEDNRIDEFKCNIDITSDTVWIILNYDAEDPNCAYIQFIGNTREECLLWWRENRTDSLDLSIDEGEMELKYEEHLGDRISGLLLKKMKIA